MVKPQNSNCTLKFWAFWLKKKYYIVYLFFTCFINQRQLFSEKTSQENDVKSKWFQKNVSFWFFCDVTVPWLFFKSKVIEFNAIITSRIYEQNKVKKPPTIKRCPDVFGFNFQLFDKICRSNSTEYSISKIYFQFLKTNSNKETAVLTFIDFAFFSAEKPVFFFFRSNLWK